MALQNIDPHTAAGAVAGSAWMATFVTGLQTFAMQVLGVPLPVVLAAAAGAGLAVARGDSMPFWKAALIAAGWTVLGCVCAPGAQAVVPSALAMVGIALTLPDKALAFIAAAGSSSSWWGPLVWPMVKKKFGLGDAPATEQGSPK